MCTYTMQTSTFTRLFMMLFILCMLLMADWTYGDVSVSQTGIVSISAIGQDTNETLLETTESYKDYITITLPRKTEIDVTFVLTIRCELASEITMDVSIPSEKISILKMLTYFKQNFTCGHIDTSTNTLVDDNTKLAVIIPLEIEVTLRTGNIGVSRVRFDIVETYADYRHDETMKYPENNSVPVSVRYDNSSTIERVETSTVVVDILVIRTMKTIDIVFLIAVYSIEILEMLTFGTQLDLYALKNTLKKPFPLLIGLSCQNIGMPLIAFVIARIVASDSVTAIGIFVAGICPGGGSSNIYTYLLGGDLPLSITMTTISTISSLVMMPLWLYTLGRIFLDPYELSVPYTDIILTLSIILVPLSCGLLIRNKLPRVVDIIEKIMSVVLTILALVLIVTGLMSCLYLFNLFNLRVTIVGCCLPYVGFILGGVMAFLFKESFKNIKTIAIETGLQNTAIAMILLQKSFSAPYGDLATVAPVAAEVMSPIPPFIAAIIYLIRKKWCKQYENVDNEKSNGVNDNQTDSDDEFVTDSEYSS